MAKFKGSVICLLIFALGFFIGMDWPYLLPPDDFGVYAFDKSYKYVINEDETRLCRQVCILDNNGQIVYHTSGYMGLGWHYGRYDLDVYWANDTYDLFVRDGRGTVDVFLYTGSTWQGPYSIRKADNSEYIIVAPPYDHNLSETTYDALPIIYDERHIPQQLLLSFSL